MQKRFLLFQGDVYYPAGGWDDFKESFDHLDAAVAKGKELGRTYWWHIYDLLDNKIAATSDD